MYKTRPPLNISSLPPVFEIPKENYNSNDTNNNSNKPNKSKGNKVNLIPISKGKHTQNLLPFIKNNKFKLNVYSKTNNTNNGIDNNNYSNYNYNISTNNVNRSEYNSNEFNNSTLNYNNSSGNFNNSNYIQGNTSYKNINYGRNKPLLKPIQMRDKLRRLNNGSNNVHSPETLKLYNDFSNRINNEFKSITNANSHIITSHKFAKTSEMYYHMMNNSLLHNDKIKQEKLLRDTEMQNISLNQNRNYVDKNIIISRGKKGKIMQKNRTLANINTLIKEEKYSYNKSEFISVTKNKSRVLHLPTLKIYDSYDIPFNVFHLRFEDYILNFKSLIYGVCEIKCLFEDKENKQFNVLVERTNNGNLRNLVKTLGPINENLLRNICKQCIQIIFNYNYTIKSRANTNINTDIKNMNFNLNKEDKFYNIVEASNLFFDSKFNVKLYPGKLRYKSLYKKLLEEELITVLNNMSDFKNEIKKQILLDIFQLGVTLINTNIIIYGITVETLLSNNSKNNHKHTQKCCCLFHCFCNGYKLINALYKEEGSYTKNYRDFLHLLTNFNIKEENINGVLENTWLNMKINNSDVADKIKNSLSELIELSKTYDFSKEYYTINQNAENFDLICKKIKEKLLSCESYFMFYSIKNVKGILTSDVKLKELAKELKISDEEVAKIIEIYEGYFNENKDKLNEDNWTGINNGENNTIVN